MMRTDRRPGEACFTAHGQSRPELPSRRRPIACCAFEQPLERHRTGSSAPRLLIQEGSHLARAGGVLQLPERLRLDLSDAFAGDAELLADFLQGVIGVHADAEAHAQYALFARSEGRQHSCDRFLEVRLDRGINWDDSVLVLDEVAEMAVSLIADRRFEADRLFCDLEDLANLFKRH